MEQNKSPNIDFSVVQKQSSVGMMIEFLFLLKKFGRMFLALAVYLLFELQWHQYIYIVLGAVVVLLLISVFSYLNYLHTQFQIHYQNKEFILNKGIFNKEKYTIQLDKILQVNINQNFWQRLLEVYAVEIETAGSTKTEAHLKALDQKVAFALKNELLKHQQKEKSAKSIEEGLLGNESGIPYQQFSDISIRPLQLFAYAFTADYFRGFMLLLGLILSFYSRIQEYLGKYFSQIGEWEEKAIDQFNLLSFLIFLLVLFIISVIANAIRTVVQYFNMSIRLEEKASWIAYGLISRKNTLIQNDRTQIFTISSNILQRQLHLFKVRISQISNDIQKDKKAKVNIIACNEAQSEQLFKNIYQQSFPHFSYSLSTSFRTLYIYIILYVLLPVLLCLGAWYSEYISTFSLLVLLFYLPLIFLLLKRYLKHYRLWVNDDFILFETRMWEEKRVILSFKDIQSVRVAQYAWHKRAGLSQLIIQTAGGSVRFRNGKKELIESLANQILYKIEKEEAKNIDHHINQ